MHKTISRSRSVSVLFILLVGSVNLCRSADKPRIVNPVAVLRFDERGAVPGGNGIGSGEIGSKISDLLFSKLAENPKLYLVDRNDLGKAFAELSLSATGAINPDAAVRVGQLVAARLLVTGSVVHDEQRLHLVAKVIGTETTRVMGVSVEGRPSDDLGDLAKKLADAISDVIIKSGDELAPKARSEEDRLAAIKSRLKAGKRPTVWIEVSETHLHRRTIDPAVQTELGRFCTETGFVVLDPEQGRKNRADVIITGEGFSETAGRINGLAAVKARVELKAVDRKTDRIIFADRQTAVAVDLAENLAGKAALQEAASILAERLLPKLAEAKR